MFPTRLPYEHEEQGSATGRLDLPSPWSPPDVEVADCEADEEACRISGLPMQTRLAPAGVLNAAPDVGRLVPSLSGGFAAGGGRPTELRRRAARVPGVTRAIPSRTPRAGDRVHGGALVRPR